MYSIKDIWETGFDSADSIFGGRVPLNILSAIYFKLSELRLALLHKDFKVLGVDFFSNIITK